MVHSVHIQSKLVTGLFPVAVCSELPIQGIVLLMGNDLAGGVVNPALEVLDSPVGDESSPVVQLQSTVFPTCAITRACARKNEINVSDFLLADSVFMSAVSDEAEADKEVVKSAISQDEVAVLGCLPSPGSMSSSDGALPVTRECLIAAQRTAPTLQKCFSSVVSNSKASGEKVTYLLDEEVLVCMWSPLTSTDSDWDAVYQVVAPSQNRQHVLTVAHESQWSEHLGVTKTWLILKHFFWPRLKSDVAKFRRGCHVCQLAGKPNQPIPHAPLHPIPVIGEPFERVIIDCVVPLPRTKSGNQYLLTVM